ncbi:MULTISPECIES: LysR family transcriptional regulator [Methylobacterium]|uniref:HTH-type transcriptional activator CmpR n=1 Tax=Methylobacterium thuringiense TaxID=1003091 RepID=A0ABQ4TPH6_9HYPH|nr:MULTISPECIES: LysR family transcriptional regulator [Methylobacterium]TXN20368.1 LysR family transcriptional regulator [Methylobacterium sp. WL9]GJE56224.1 HTH-type transcriptional activator CmpR [Methylobacterium thuringiense]
MNSNDLEAFLAVVETGSLMAAAARLNLTQPGVTRRVQNLEAQLGVQLFERPAKPLRPTLAGREAYEHGRRVLQSIEDLRSGAAPNGAIRGELRIGVTIDLSEPALAAPIDALRESFPDLTIRLTVGWSPLLMEQVARNQIDAAAITLPESARPPEDLVAEELRVQDVVVVAGRDLALPETAALADLARHPWVTSQDGCGFRTTLRRRMEAEGLSLTVAVEAPSTDLRLSLVARGMGLAIVTPGKLAQSPWRDRIRVVAVRGFAPQIRSWLIYRPATGRLRRPIALFRDGLRAEIGADAVSGSFNAA